VSGGHIVGRFRSHLSYPGFKGELSREGKAKENKRGRGRRLIRGGGDTPGKITWEWVLKKGEGKKKKTGAEKKKMEKTKRDNLFYCPR